MEEFQKQIDELKSQITGLLAENNNLRHNEITRQKASFEKIFDTIIAVIENGDLVQFKFDSVIEEIKSNEVMIKLSEVNNPTSSFLGFNFFTVIKKACDDHLLSDLPEGQKVTFMEFVSRIVNNPIVKAVLHSNPITKMVSSVIDRVDTFMSTEVAKQGKELVTKMKHVIQEKKVVNFYNSLKKYIDFYDALLEASNQYNIAVDNVIIKYQGVQNEYSGYYSKFIEVMGLNKNQNLVPQINKMFEIKTVGNYPNYTEIIENEKVKIGYAHAEKFKIFQQTVDLIRADYNAILINYLDANISALETSKSFSDDSMDKGETIKIISKIETLMKKLQNEK